MGNLKTSFRKDACLAGVVMGLAVFVVYLLGAFFKWELTASGGMIRSVLTLVVLAGGAFLFGFRRAAKARAMDEVFGYGQALGFLVVAMLIAAAVGAIGMVLLQTLIAPDYYREVFAYQRHLAEQVLESSPLLSGMTSGEEMEQGMALGARPAVQLFGTFFNVAITGVLVSLFVAIFVKR